MNMNKENKIRVIIADDHAILRAGLRMLINAQPDMTVVADVQNGQQAIETTSELKPDVVLLDITMPVSGGLHAIAEILKRYPAVRVLLLTMHSEPAYLRTALAAGASGYVLKKSVDADLLSAIRAVQRGRRYVDSELAGTLLDEVIGAKKDDSPSAGQGKLLSDREMQVLTLVAEGFSSREIANRIYVSTKTVETYRARFAEKLGLKTRADVVRYALDLGLLSAERFIPPKRESNARKAQVSAKGRDKGIKG
jgi:two-component system, NarL family, response regulator NreC